MRILTGTGAWQGLAVQVQLLAFTRAMWQYERQGGVGVEERRALLEPTRSALLRKYGGQGAEATRVQLAATNAVAGGLAASLAAAISTPFDVARFPRRLSPCCSTCEWLVYCLRFEHGSPARFLRSPSRPLHIFPFSLACCCLAG